MSEKELKNQADVNMPQMGAIDDEELKSVAGGACPCPRDPVTGFTVDGKAACHPDSSLFTGKYQPGC